MLLLNVGALALPFAPWIAAFAALLLCSGCRCLMDSFAGASSRDPERMAVELSPQARALVERAYADVDAAQLVDYHVHVVGLGEDGSGCYVNPRMLTWLHPLEHVKFLAYRSAARIDDLEHAESDYLRRLATLARGQRGKFLVLAFDEHRDPTGAVVADKTEFHVPNDYVLRVADESPDLFVAAASIHPLRPDALPELERCAARGVRIVKWLPNAMGIDPSDPRCAPFYERMRELGVALLSHGGHEKAVHAEEDQRLGNPLLVRAALEHGVKVIVAHGAGLGNYADLDDPARARAPAWELLLRMLDDPRWEGLLFADISAVTLVNHTPEPLRTLLRREDLHRRLVNGSDYPLPAVNVVIWTSKLASLGMITPDERRALNEIYDFNPIVFDYVLKRCLVARDADGREHRFAPSVFEEHPELPARAR